MSAWQIDEASGLPFIVLAGQKNYKHPPCPVCGVMRLGLTTTPPKDECADFIQGVGCIPCKAHVAENNDNIHPDDQDGQGVFRL